MNMTRASLRAAVILNTGRSDKADLINTALNLAMDDISQQHLWKQMQQSYDDIMEVGDYSWALPATALKVLSCRLVDPTNLTLVHTIALKTKDWVLSRWPNPSSTSNGIPIVAYVDSGRIWFDRPVVVAYHILWTQVQMLPHLVNDTDFPACPFLDNALVSWATQYVFRSVQDQRGADMWLMQYRVALRDAIAFENHDPGLDIRAEEFVRAASGEMNRRRIVAEAPIQMDGGM